MDIPAVELTVEPLALSVTSLDDDVQAVKTPCILLFNNNSGGAVDLTIKKWRSVGSAPEDEEQVVSIPTGRSLMKLTYIPYGCPGTLLPRGFAHLTFDIATPSNLQVVCYDVKS